MKVISLGFISYRHTGRSNLTTEVLSSDDIVDELCANLTALKKHDIFAKQESIYLNHSTKALQEGELLVLCHFAENYAFFCLTAAQSFHWNNNQVFLRTSHYGSDGRYTVYMFQKVLLSPSVEQNVLAKKKYFFQRCCSSAL